MIAGFVEPTAARSGSRAATSLAVKPAKRGLGIVFQSYALFPHMTVAENVAFGLEMQGVAAAEREQARRRDAGAGRPRRPSPAASRASCRAASSSAWRSPARWSSGRRSCCSTSRSRNLDAKLREEMQIELRQIQRTVGTTTILVTHDQAEAMALSRPHRGDEPRPRRADRPAARGLRAAGDAVRRGLPRQDQLVNGATVRPEKISVRDLGLAGKVRTRIFQGNHWLYQVETADGLVTVIRQNTGEAMPAEGEAVLGWSARPAAT